MLVEDDIAIHVRGCERCGCAIGMPYWKCRDTPPPPRKGWSKEEISLSIISWENYCDKREEEIRKTLEIR